jgi:hypothetical protein
MNGKGFGRKLSRPNARYYAGIGLEELRKITKTSVSIAGRRTRDLSPGPPEYEASVNHSTTKCGFKGWVVIVPINIPYIY